MSDYRVRINGTAQAHTHTHTLVMENKPIDGIYNDGIHQFVRLILVSLYNRRSCLWFVQSPVTAVALFTDCWQIEDRNSAIADKPHNALCNMQRPVWLLKTCPLPSRVFLPQFVILGQTVRAFMKEIHAKILIFRVLPFKVTQGHRNRQRSLCYL